MTVEELNIKITADAENFKRAVSEANSAMESFRRRAVSAGEEVSSAFSGLLGVSLSGTLGEPSGSRKASAAADSPERAAASAAFAESTRVTPSTEGFIEWLAREGTSARTAALPKPEERDSTAGTADQAVSEGTSARAVFLPETVTNDNSSGTAGSSAGEETVVQPVNITTEIVLDGDKVGESVSRYFFRRNRITNGIEE
ncbi:MAG: hypothetical protein K5876_04650 [Ruminiclostridium sp.]|nr:hypothetical protein [Ruminiclostridium sp.]